MKQTGTRPAGAGHAVLAIGAHPDDIEFMMAGTLILLKRSGWDVHCMNLGDGRCGTADAPLEQIVATRAAEARKACELIGATHHDSIAADLQIRHDTPTVAKVVAVIRRVRPGILLLHSPFDYMRDHVNAARIGVTAAFARGMAHFPSDPETAPISGDVTIYHALPYGLRDPLGRVVRPGEVVDVIEAMDLKRRMLACHASQQQWLQASQGAEYLDTMAEFCRQVGRMSGRFELAEGWQRRNYLGLSAVDRDPLSDALGPRCRVNEDYEASRGGLQDGGGEEGTNMASDPVIRDGGAADIEKMAAIAVEVWRPYYDYLRGRMGPELFAAVHPDGAREKARHVRDGCDPRHNPGIAVAEIDGRVVAFVTFYVNVSAGVGEIGHNAVHPDFQGRGIGPRLYEHALERLRAAGMRLAKVTTGLDPTHERARRAYEKVGFQPGEEAVTYYRRL